MSTTTNPGKVTTPCSFNEVAARNEAQPPHHVHSSTNANKIYKKVETILRRAWLGSLLVTGASLGGRDRINWG